MRTALLKYSSFSYVWMSVCLGILVVLINSDSTSPFFYIWTLDSQVFQYMGYAMTEGQVPYTDLFDHKGLFIYLMNALGYLISHDFGVHLLQMVNLSLTLMIWYRMLDGVDKVWRRHLYILAAVLYLCIYYDCGNMSEEWSLLFVSYPLLAYHRLLKAEKTRFDRKTLILIGICIGMVTIIRMNNMAPVIGMLFYCLICACLRKEYGYIGRAILFIFLGFAMPVFAACLYMGIVGGLQGIADMFYGTFLFNMEYMRVQGAASFDIAKYGYLFDISLPVLIVLPLIRKQPERVVPLLFCFLLMVVSLGKSFYDHYLITFLPIVVASLACLDFAKYSKYVIPLLVAYEIFVLFTSFDDRHFDTHQRKTNIEAFQQIINPIPENERDQIWNLGSGYLLDVMKDNHIIQMNRMILYFQLNVSSALFEKEAYQVQSAKPKYVIFWEEYPKDYAYISNLTNYTAMDGGPGLDADIQFVKENYQRLSSTKWADNGELVCYKRIDP